MRSRAISFVFLWCTFVAVAQSSSFIYQGRLAEAGRSASGTYDFIFRLYDHATDGAQQGASEPRSEVLVNEGAFCVSLDFGSVVFSGAERWLEISVRKSGSGNDYVVLTPRQEIAPTPYALRAAVASEFTGRVADGQLSTNVALLDGSQAFGGTVRFSSAVGSFAGDGSGLTNLNAVTSGGFGMFTGRLNQLPSSTGVFFGMASGASDATSLANQVSTLSPGQAATAANLSVRLFPPPGPGNSLTFMLMVNGADTTIQCTLSDSMTSANSGAMTAVVPPGSELALKVVSTGAPSSSYAMFGWTLK